MLKVWHGLTLLTFARRRDRLRGWRDRRAVLSGTCTERQIATVNSGGPYMELSLA